MPRLTPLEPTPHVTLKCSLRLLEHAVNQGKGAALHTGIREATGDYVIIQDADLEYDPEEYNLLIKPIIKGFADVVFGSRFLGGKPAPHPVFLAQHRQPTCSPSSRIW